MDILSGRRFTRSLRRRGRLRRYTRAMTIPSLLLSALVIPAAAQVRGVPSAPSTPPVNIIAFPAPGLDRHGAFDMFQSMSLGSVVVAHQGVLQDPVVRRGPSVIAVPADRVPHAVAAMSADRVDAAPLPELAATAAAAAPAPLSSEADAAAAARLFDGAVRERAGALGALAKALDPLDGAAARLSETTRHALASLLEKEARDYDAVLADEAARRNAALARRAAGDLRRAGRSFRAPGEPVRRRVRLDFDGRGVSRFVLSVEGVPPDAPDLEATLAAAAYAANRALERYLVEVNRGSPRPAAGWPEATLRAHVPEDMPVSARLVSSEGGDPRFAVTVVRHGVRLEYTVSVPAARG